MVAALIGAMGVSLRAGVFSWEANSFPVDAGWELVQQFCQPQTSLESGWYIEDVDREACPDERDQAKLNRDNLLPIVFVDIEPGKAHVHRLELYGADLYIWYIDGEIVDSGIPEGAFPADNARIVFTGRSWHLPSVIRWNYIRYGDIPAPNTGDFRADVALAGLLMETGRVGLIDADLRPCLDRAFVEIEVSFALEAHAAGGLQRERRAPSSGFIRDAFGGSGRFSAVAGPVEIEKQ